MVSGTITRLPRRAVEDRPVRAWTQARTRSEPDARSDARRQGKADPARGSASANGAHDGLRAMRDPARPLAYRAPRQQGAPRPSEIPIPRARAAVRMRNRPRAHWIRLDAATARQEIAGRIHRKRPVAPSATQWCARRSLEPARCVPRDRTHRARQHAGLARRAQNRCTGSSHRHACKAQCNRCFRQGAVQIALTIPAADEARHPVVARCTRYGNCP